MVTALSRRRRSCPSAPVVGAAHEATHCGLPGPRVNVRGATTYLLDDGRQFEAQKGSVGMTCKSCLRSQRRIAEAGARKGAFLDRDARDY